MNDISAEPESRENGEAVKGFWDHVQDLRKAVIRSVIAVGVAVILCLMIADKLVALIEYPLRKIDLFEKPRPTVSFQLGENRLGPYPVSREQFSALPPGAAPHVVFQVDTAKVGEAQVLTLKIDPKKSDGGESALQIKLHNFGPAEGFFIAFHVALYGALIISSPFWMYFMGGFIMPALKSTERRMIFPWLGWSVFLFLAGVSMTYFVLLPVSLRASVEYSNLLGFEGLDWRAEDYISFVTHFIFGMGLGFQFPVVVLLLVKLGLITHKHLIKYRRHVVVLSLILGAVLTTPEVITQVAMAVPLYLLYETCIWIAWYWDWKKRRAEKMSPDAPIDLE